MVVLSVAEYQSIVHVIKEFTGLWIECPKHVQALFPYIDPVVLNSIVSREGQYRLRQTHSAVSRDIRKILNDYQNRARERRNTICDDVILRIAAEMKFSPICLSRLLLTELYKDLDKKDVSEMVKQPNTIPDLTLGLNVLKCQMNDNLDGPITDNVRRFVGEEYEVLVRQPSMNI